MTREGRFLSLPDPRHLPATSEGLTQYDAVCLFLDRATTALPSFALTSQNALVVARAGPLLTGDRVT